MDKEVRLEKGKTVVQTAFWLEGVLVIAKVVIGLISGSLTLISDAIHSAADILTIITSWLGLKIAQKKADERFPYGYYKAESLGAAIISLLIIYAGVEMIVQGYGRLFSFSSIKIPFFALAISLLDALILFFFGAYEIKIGKQVNAQSLIAMGKENRTHVFSSSAVFLGTLAAFYQIPYLEGVVTIIISLLILKIGLTTAKESVFALMDVAPEKEVKEKVVKAIEAVAGIEELLSLRLRQSGPFVLGEAKVAVRKTIDVKRSHAIADQVEGRVKKAVSQIDSFIVHVEPFKSDWQHLVFPLANNKGLDSRIADQLARAPYFLFLNLKGKKIKGFYSLKNPYQKQKSKAGLAAAKFISKQKGTALITRQVGEIAFYSLKESLFDLYQTKKRTVKEAVKDFVKGKSEALTRATKRE